MITSYSDEGDGNFVHQRVLGTMKDQANWISHGFSSAKAALIVMMMMMMMMACADRIP